MTLFKLLIFNVFRTKLNYFFHESEAEISSQFLPHFQSFYHNYYIPVPLLHYSTLKYL